MTKKQKYKFWLRKVSKKQVEKLPRLRCFIAMDTETDPETGEFLFGALYGKYRDHHKKTHKVEFTTDDRFVLQNELLELAKKGGKKNNSYNLVFFNAMYDLFYLEEIVDDNRTVINGDRLITARIKGGTYDSEKERTGIKVYDVTNYVRGSLESWIEMLGMREKYGIRKLSLDNLEERCLADAKATYYLMKFLEAFFVCELKIPLQLTIGSSALKYYQNYFLPFELYREERYENLNRFERKAYRGGRCEVFKRGKRRVKVYDINSMYLSIMFKYKFPLPQTGRLSRDQNLFEKLFYESETDMIIDCKVHVKNQHIPPLPYKADNNSKLIFPVGAFRGVWTDKELKKAIEYDTRIEEVYNFIYYKKSDYIFKSFAKNVWELREKYRNSSNNLNPNYDFMIKTIGNSLYGKFGQQINREGKWVKISDYKGDLTGLRIDKFDKYVYINPEKREDTSKTFPCIAVFITSYARILLLNFLKRFERDVVYCDTDSIHVLAEKINLENSKSFGELAFEYEGEQTYYKPKFYGAKFKGVPKSAKKVKEDDDKIIFQFEKPSKRKESIVQGISQNVWRLQEKILSKEDDKRVWLENNESRPINIQELEREEEEKRREKILARDYNLHRKWRNKIYKEIKESDIYDPDLELTLRSEREEEAIREAERWLQL